MTRPLRMNIGGAIYYITLQGSNREKIFSDKRDYQRYLSLLSKYKARYGYRIYAFLLIRDQIQLVIEPPFPNLSQIMHSINTTYTMYFNERHNHRGHLFQRRYKSLIINRKEHLLDLTKYIHLYPMMSGLSENLEDYPWSSYSFYIEGYGSSLIDREGVLKLLGEDIDYQVEAYKKLLEEESSTIDQISDRSYDRVLEEFIDSIKGALEPHLIENDKPRPSISQIIDIIADYYQIEEKNIFFEVRSKKNGPLRQMAIYISRIMGDKKLNELAQSFGGVSCQAVSKSLSSFEQRLRLQEDLKRDMDIICRRIR